MRLQPDTPAQHVADVHNEAARQRVHPSPRCAISANLRSGNSNGGMSLLCCPPELIRGLPGLCRFGYGMTDGKSAYLQPRHAICGQQGQHACTGRSETRVSDTGMLLLLIRLARLPA